MTHVIDELVRTKKELDVAALEAKVFFTNKDFSLDQRWDWFEALASARLLPEKPWVDNHLHILGENLTYYDDFCLEKYSVMSYPYMYDRIMEDEDVFAPERVSAWREAVLAAGYGSFTYDW